MKKRTATDDLLLKDNKIVDYLYDKIILFRIAIFAEVTCFYLAGYLIRSNLIRSFVFLTLGIVIGVLNGEVLVEQGRREKKK